MRTLLAAMTMAIISSIAFAQAPPTEEIALTDPGQEARAQKIARQIRCVVCKAQSVAESDAPLAADMRNLIRERIIAGDDDREIYAYFADRYGDRALLRPPVATNTAPLYLGPLLILIVAGAVGARRAFGKMRKKTSGSASS